MNIKCVKYIFYFLSFFFITCCIFTIKLAAQLKSAGIVNATVIDATGSFPKPNMTVIITGNLIERTIPSGRAKIPQNALITNGKGEFLTPGLWDMHIHTENYEWSIYDEDSFIGLGKYDVELELNRRLGTRLQIFLKK